MKTRIKTSKELDDMRISGQMLATVLNLLHQHVSEGMSTLEIADLARNELKKLGGQPTFLGYLGFPDVICISINNQVVHGIPSNQCIVHNGDIVSLDFGVTYNQMITDGAISFILDQPLKKNHQLLVDRTKNSLLEGISQLKNNVRVGDISHAIEKYLDQFGYGIVKDLVGHGVGHHLHEEPNIPNYGYAHQGPVLKTGMTIAIEPMVTLGTDRVAMLEDGWTIVTEDDSLAAHFEHTVLILDNSFEILTEVK